MKFLTITIACASFLLATPCWAGEPVRAFQGSRTLTKAKHLMPQMKDGEGYGQKYTFNADFGDRGSLYYSLTISNLGFGDHKMEAKGRLTIDGKKFAWKKNLDEDEWSFDKSKLYIKAGPATLSGTPKDLKLQVSKGDQAFELNFTPIANPWRPRNGRILYGKKRKVSDYTVFPLMAVKGRFKQGGEWKDLEGIGYGTHSWAELAIYEMATMTQDFRGISGNKTVYMRRITTGGDFEKKTVGYLLITKGKEVLIESFDVKMTPTDVMTDNKHDNKYKVPESFQLLGVDAELKDSQFRGKITKKKLRKRKDILKSMNGAVAAVVGRYSKPVQYEYDADFLIEVKTANGVERIEGVGRHEIYHLNK